eukprot:m.105317 g.105317  ORF g.105317 m.105317 type:complete len:750 (-) comp9139_c0_seq5:172-2421(-)
MASPQKQGWLLKWTNYMKGFRQRWFVLDSGVLSYYRTPDDMAYACRGTLVLKDATLEVEGGANFVIHTGATKKTGQHFYLRAASEKERYEWIMAIEASKHQAAMDIHSSQGIVVQSSDGEMPAYFEDSESEEEELLSDDESVVTDPAYAQGLQSKFSLLRKAHESLYAYATETSEKLERLVEAHPEVAEEVGTTMEHLKGAAALLLNISCDFLNDITAYQKKWHAVLRLNETKRKQLEESLEELALQHRKLEKTADRLTRTGVVIPDDGLSSRSASASDAPSRLEDDEDEFFDAASEDGDLASEDTGVTEITPSTPTPSDGRVAISQSSEAAGSAPEASVTPAAATADLPLKLSNEFSDRKFVRRTAIPFRPNKSVNLWSILKNCIGKDLSKIPMPVNFNEPLSFLQRLTEDLEYASILDEAVMCTDPSLRMAHVAAFTVSSFANVTNRVSKPYNPLLGETFEIDRRAECGWRAVVEQVSHHPPICAMHAESSTWIYWQEFSMTSKFRGKYIEIIPTGISHLIFKEHGDHYTWTKVATTVHNIIVGQLWVDQGGQMTITNHYNRQTCDLDYIPFSYFSRGKARRVEGVIRSPSGAEEGFVSGTWDESLAYKSGSAQQSEVVLWKRFPLVPNSEKMYGFTKFALTLNEMSPVDAGCASTDSRYRPDKNLQEQQDFDGANKVKQQLEEAQRRRRKVMEAAHETWTPIWFEKKPDPVVEGRFVHQFIGDYWSTKEDGSWTAHRSAPNIYELP